MHHPNDKWVSNYNQSTNYKRKRKRRRATNMHMYTGLEWREPFTKSPIATTMRKYAENKNQALHDECPPAMKIETTIVRQIPTAKPGTAIWGKASPADKELQSWKMYPL
jgi:hypothetical protein